MLLDAGIVALVALVAGGLTLYSGFGVGTLLLPVYAVFLPLELAVAATAIVHAANNVLKVSLLGRDAVLRVALRFGAPAVIAAFLGAELLDVLGDLPVAWSPAILGEVRDVTVLDLVLGSLMAVFAIAELAPARPGGRPGDGHLLVGGAVSGFFGGLSGHQGALRAAFLARLDLTPAQFVGTGAVVSLAVDLVRLTTYAVTFMSRETLARPTTLGLLAAGVVGAFAGILIGRRFLHRTTLRFIQIVVGGLLLVIGAGVATGLI